MAIEIWTLGELYDVLVDDRLDDFPSYFLDNFFKEEYLSGDKEIHFSELPAMDRKMAPFVLPTEQGKPIFGARGESKRSFTPPYIKPKDAVRAEDARNRRPSEIFRNGGQPLTVEERFENRIVEIVEYHKRAIKMQWSYMAARAYIDASLVIKYQRDQGAPFPEVTIDFGRDANLNVTLSGSFWSDPAYNIIGDLSTWSDRMYNALRGGRPVRLTLGSAVVPYFLNNNGIKALLDTNYRGGEDTSIKRGIVNIDRPLSYVGTIGGIGQSLEIWTYKDQVENSDGNMVDLLDPKTVLLEAPGYRGIRAFGAIYDVEAMQSGQSLSTDIFPKMFVTKDPGELYVMHQSAPLMIPATPNRVLKAVVLS